MSNKAKNKIPERDSQYRSNLLALVSHELNTPLTGILNAISVLEQRFPQEQDFMPMLRRNAERLRVTVENMINLAQADAGILRVHLTETALENIVQGEMEALKPRLAREGFEFSGEVEEDLPTVCADPMRLRRVFCTFVENAMKFSLRGTIARREPRVEVGLRMMTVHDIKQVVTDADWKMVEKKTGTFLVVSVASSLPPIGELPDSFADLFEPFSPWKDIYTREKEGMGVELALAREILLAHHGFIAAGSPKKDASGWVFYFGLPVLSRQDELEFVINNRIRGALGALSKTSILVIRPDPESTAGNKRDLKHLEEEVRSLLYRSSDSVFQIPSSGEVTIVMDDCNAKGAERLAERLVKDLREVLPGLGFVWGSATGPDHGVTAHELIAHAVSSWRAE